MLQFGMLKLTTKRARAARAEIAALKGLEIANISLVPQVDSDGKRPKAEQAARQRVSPIA